MAFLSGTSSASQTGSGGSHPNPFEEHMTAESMMTEPTTTENSTKEQDLDDLNMLRYFWQEKGDMTRYYRYKECIHRFPLIRHARDNLELAEAMMDAAFDKQEIRIS